MLLISLIHHIFFYIGGNKNIREELKKKKKKGHYNLDRAKQKIPGENKGFGGDLD